MQQALDIIDARRNLLIERRDERISWIQSWDPGLASYHQVEDWAREAHILEREAMAMGIVRAHIYRLLQEASA